MISTQQQDLVAKPCINSSIEAILCRSILTAHLLISDIAEAEQVVMEAIDNWSLNEDNGEQIFQTTLRIAARRLSSANSIKIGVMDCKLPIELRRVLELPPDLRKSFVLRILVGLPLQVCAHMLEMSASKIYECSVAAMKKLAVDS